MRLSETVKPISYVKSHAAEIVRDISSTRQPVIITQNGEARAVLIDLAEYENIRDSLAMLKLAAMGSGEVRAGKVKSATAAFASIDAEINGLKKTIRK